MIPTRRVRRDVNGMNMYPSNRQDEDEGEYYDDEAADRRSLPNHQAPVYRDPRTRYIKKESSFGTWVFVGTIVSVSILVSLFTFIFNSATVTIVPKYKDVEDFGRPIVFALVTQNATDTQSVPYTIATSSLSKTKSLTLSESRKVEAKASGKVIIYNNYDSNPQKLIKNTRFESAKGKIYRINQSLTIPGKKGQTPGSIEVMLYADSNGADYNSDATDFTIPGFKGTPRESAFYARSKGAITGGSSGKVSLASLSDVNAAKDELALELAQEIKADLLKVKKEGYIGLYSGIEITYSDNEDQVLKGITGTYQVTATGYLMLADGKKLAQSIAKTTREYDGEPVRLAYVDSLSFTRKEIDHIGSPLPLSILVEGKPRVIWNSDADAIKEMVKGKKRDEFKPLMKAITSIEGAEISFSPMWLSTFPTDTIKISVVESLPKR
jgi:hypothetical protein